VLTPRSLETVAAGAHLTHGAILVEPCAHSWQHSCLESGVTTHTAGGTTMKCAVHTIIAAVSIGLVASHAGAQEARRLTWNANPEGTRADTATHPKDGDGAELRRSRDDLVRAGYAYSAFGIAGGRAAGAGVGAVRDGFGEGEDPRGAGGLRVWGAPVSRLTLLAEVERHFERDEIAPSAGLLVTALGSRKQGWALAGLGRYKLEGFAEAEGEVEAGVLFSLARGRWFADVNGIMGTAFEESELDGEGLLRAGFVATDWLTVGVDSQVRYRLAGDLKLAGGRSWDAVAGPQLVASYSHFFAALSGGPTTMGIANGIGWSTLAVIGGSVP